MVKGQAMMKTRHALFNPQLLAEETIAELEDLLAFDPVSTATGQLEWEKNVDRRNALSSKLKTIFTGCICKKWGILLFS